MLDSGHPTAAQRPAGTGTAAVRRGERLRLGRAWLPVLPAVVTLLVGLYGITGPSFTGDECATLAAVRRSFPQLISMLHNVDVVHGAYYALIWCVAQVAGRGELVVRFPSAVAMAVAAAAVTLLGRRIVSGWAGLAAGLTFAALPSVSWFAEDAREGAIVTALAALASYCFVRVLGSDGSQSRRRWLTGYAVLLTLLGLANLFGLLLVVAHGVALAGWRDGGRRAGWRMARGWVVAVVVALAAVSPVVVTGYGQLHQIQWLQPPGLAALVSVERVVGPPGLFTAALVVVGCALAFSALRGRARFRAQWPPALWWLCLPWLVGPPAILLLASLAHPVFTYRYIAYCIPAAALLLGAALAALGRYAGPLALVLIVATGLQAQTAMRGPAGHGFRIREADQIVARHAEPGDALLHIALRPPPDQGTAEDNLVTAYPFGLARLRDIGRGAPAASSATLGGGYAPDGVIRARLRTVRRVWVVEANGAAPVPVLDHLGFRLSRGWLLRGLSIRLYARHASRA